MRYLLSHLLFALTITTAAAQNFTGQWKGEFIDRQNSVFSSTEDVSQYVVDLQCQGAKITGTSYTYFYSMGKKYYTICKIAGKVNRQEHTLVLREIERIKSNVPEDVDNYFQEHTLSYNPYSVETLRGTWTSTRSRDGLTSYGSTTLHRRTLASLYPSLSEKKSIAKADIKTQRPQPKLTTETVAVYAKQQPAVAQTNAPVIPQQKLPESQDLLFGFSKKEIQIDPALLREENIIHSIAVKSKLIKIELYDNGEIDGDSVSVYFNKKLILCRQRLSEKPLSLTITMPDDATYAKLVMFAENLGTIPPNTALMVLHDDGKRYEIRVTSDLTKSGAIMLYKKE